MTFQPREIVRTQPYRAQQEYIGEVVLNNGTIGAIFDTLGVTTDPAQLVGAQVTAAIPAVGPFLDVTVYSTGIGTLDVILRMASTGQNLTMLAAPIAVPALTMFPAVVGLRIPARFVSVVFTNTSGGSATVDFCALLGSN